MDQFKLADIFRDGMIVQRDIPISVYGVAFAPCVIEAEMDGSVRRERVGTGSFCIRLPAHGAGEGLAFSVSSGEQRVLLKNVYCGEVWVAGGQSNMAMSLKDTAGYKNGEVPSENERIRFYTVGRNSLAAAEEFGEGYRWAFNRDMGWAGCGKASAPNFSAAGYYFALSVYEKLRVPVGVISCNVGGSGIFSWMPEETLLKNKNIRPVLDRYQAAIEEEDPCASLRDYQKYLDGVNETWNREEYLQSSGGELPTVYYEGTARYSFKRPACLYHAMLKKIDRYSVRGMIWYQGESEAFTECAALYKSAMVLLTGFLKERAQNSRYQFHFVQLAPWNDPSVRQWEDVCNAQREFFMDNPVCGMVTIGDCSGGEDIHPPLKRPVGERLALAAFALTYGFPCEYTGPCAVKAAYADGRIAILFSHAAGLHARGDIGLFEVKSGDGIRACPARVEGGLVLIDYGGSLPPEQVRYAWCAYPHIGLFNGRGFPASIFKINIENK